jgi:hypothetical protein
MVAARTTTARPPGAGARRLARPWACAERAIGMPSLAAYGTSPASADHSKIALPECGVENESNGMDEVFSSSTRSSIASERERGGHQARVAMRPSVDSRDCRAAAGCSRVGGRQRRPRASVKSCPRRWVAWLLRPPLDEAPPSPPLRTPPRPHSPHPSPHPQFPTPTHTRARTRTRTHTPGAKHAGTQERTLEREKIYRSILVTGGAAHKAAPPQPVPGPTTRRCAAFGPQQNIGSRPARAQRVARSARAKQPAHGGLEGPLRAPQRGASQAMIPIGDRSSGKGCHVKPPPVVGGGQSAAVRPLHGGRPQGDAQAGLRGRRSPGNRS